MSGRNLLVTSVELYSARYVEDGFVAEEVWLSTDAKPIEIVRTNFVISPLRGSRVAVLKGRKEGRKEGVCVSHTGVLFGSY